MLSADLSSNALQVQKLEKRVVNRDLLIGMWKDAYHEAERFRDDALFREGVALSMRDEAEMRLKNLEADHSRLGNEGRERNREHAKEVAELKERMKAEKERNTGGREPFRLLGRIEEMIRSLDVSHECKM